MQEHFFLSLYDKRFEKFLVVNVLRTTIFIKSYVTEKVNQNSSLGVLQYDFNFLSILVSEERCCPEKIEFKTEDHFVKHTNITTIYNSYNH